MNRIRYPLIDMARGICIFFIVWAHVDQKIDKYFYVVWLEQIHLIIYSFHVPLLFMISGILQNDITKTISFSITLKNSVKKILTPYFTLNLLFLVINFMVPRSFTKGPSLIQMLKSLCYMQSHPEWLPSGVLWFLWALFSIIIINFVSLNFFKINRYVWVIIAFIVQLLSVFLSSSYFFGIDRITANLFFYVFGYALSEIIMNSTKKTNVFKSIVFFVIWFAAFKLWRLFPQLKQFKSVTGVCGALYVLFLCDYLLRRYKKITNIFCYLGKKSMIIFVLHMPVSLIIFKCIHFLKLSNNFFIFLIMLFSGLLFPLLIGKVIEINPFCYQIFFGRLPYNHINKKFKYPNFRILT